VRGIRSFAPCAVAAVLLGAVLACSGCAGREGARHVRDMNYKPDTGGAPPPPMSETGGRREVGRRDPNAPPAPPPPPQ
jgi:hypothetical protein